MQVKSSIFLAFAALVALTLAGCQRTPDEARVRMAIAQAADAAMAGDASGLASVFTDDFDGNHGELDRRAVKRMVAALALRGEHLGVTTGPVSVERRGQRLVATFTVTLTSGGRWLPDHLGVYRVESGWRRDGSHWRCYTATWTHAL